MKAKRIKYIDEDGISHNLKDLTGQRFGRLVVLEIAKVDKKRGAIWKCKCDCSNNEIEVPRDNLISGYTQSCGCLRKEKARQSCFINHKHSLSVKVGEKYGKLTILEVCPQKKAGKSALCLCQCDCGSEPKWIEAHALRRGNTKSCGCIVSYGEQKISQLLKENNIHFKSQKTFSDCINPKTNTKLRFDFYLLDYDICIEYDGEQHFKDKISLKSYFTPKQLSDIKYRDNIKNKYCLKHNIRLIRIPYTEKDKLTTDFIYDIIFNNDVYDVKDYE